MQVYLHARQRLTHPVVERSGELDPFFLSDAGGRLMELSFNRGDTMMQAIKQKRVLVRNPCVDS
jgi:hypothetical protein